MQYLFKRIVIITKEMLTLLNAEMMHSFKWLLSKKMFQGLTKQIRNNKKSRKKIILTLQTFQIISPQLKRYKLAQPQYKVFW